MHSAISRFRKGVFPAFSEPQESRERALPGFFLPGFFHGFAEGFPESHFRGFQDLFAVLRQDFVVFYSEPCLCPGSGIIEHPADPGERAQAFGVRGCSDIYLDDAAYFGACAAFYAKSPARDVEELRSEFPLEGFAGGVEFPVSDAGRYGNPL